MSNYPWKCLQDIKFQYKIVLPLKSNSSETFQEKKQEEKINELSRDYLCQFINFLSHCGQSLFIPVRFFFKPL